jgi:hypothetical protein
VNVSEDKNELQKECDANVRAARRYRRRDAFWGNVQLVFWVLVVAAVVGGVCWVVYAHVDDYRGQCHDAGGHIIDIRDAEICVDRDNRVILL